LEKEFEKQYHQFEEKHFWFKSRRRLIINMLSKADKRSSILDIGCSSGLLLTDLNNSNFNSSNLYGIDISKDAINESQNRGHKNTFVMDAQNIILDKKFDYIIASDCLEHLRDDSKALKNWRNLLKDEGTLIVFVPAFMFLWSYHDEINMHYRRYTEKMLTNKVKKTGFNVIKSGYWNFTLFLPVVLYRYISKAFAKRTKTDINTIGSFNGILFKILDTENKLINFLKFPYGVSTFCVLKKTS
jgi:2-polyprenyl-3-methyl-5-hydroxy-6-metoxy-1,4-benzoquinol methylase